MVLLYLKKIIHCSSEIKINWVFYLFVFNFAKFGYPDQTKTTLIKIILYIA